MFRARPTAEQSGGVVVADGSEQGGDNLAKIEHVVVMMLENRSFDHMLGYLSLTGRRPDPQTGCPAYVTGDAESARAGAFLGAPGLVVIAGTGSAAYGWNGESSLQAGGHGFLLGDEGSAYWIGRAAVRAALRFQDQMGGSEPLHRAVIQAAGKDLDALVSDVCTHPAERDRLTVLAPAVTALAAGDLQARKIALKAAEHLAGLAGSILRRLGPLPVAGAGGVFDAPVVWDRFAELTGAVRPAATAAVGAALLAGQHQRDRA
jgi:glucosamine kinase